MSASSSGEADPPLRKVERVVLNALGPIPWDEILTARARWLRRRVYAEKLLKFKDWQAQL